MIVGKNNIWFLIVSGLILLLLYKLSPMLAPFLIAASLAYCLDPLADYLEVKKFSRTLAVTIVFLCVVLLILLVFLLIIPLLETQIKHFIIVLPDYINLINTVLVPFLSNHFSIDPNVFEIDYLKSVIASNWRATGGILKSSIQVVSKSGFVILEGLATLTLIPLLTFYLLRDWDRLIAYIHDLIPRSVEPIVVEFARESDQVLSSFLRGQLSVMLVLSIIYVLGLSIVGLEFALLIGLIAGIVSFVPYLGFIAGMSIASLAVLFQTQNALDLLGVFLVFGVGQLIESFILTPYLIGERIGLHPVTVIFSIMAGGELFGFVGVLLALPIAAVLAVIMRHIHASYKKSNIYHVDLNK